MATVLQAMMTARVRVKQSERHEDPGPAPEALRQREHGVDVRRPEAAHIRGAPPDQHAERGDHTARDPTSTTLPTIARGMVRRGRLASSPSGASDSNPAYSKIEKTTARNQPLAFGAAPGLAAAARSDRGRG